MLFFLQMAEIAIHSHFIVEFIHLYAHFSNHFAIDGNAAIGDHFFGIAAGSNAGQGKEFLQSHHIEINLSDSVGRNRAGKRGGNGA